MLLLVALLAIGFTLAKHKPLWNDEIFTQISTVGHLSYARILKARLPHEGNSCPLFYLLQKAFCDITHYSVPKQWYEGQWGHVDPLAEILLRVNPVFFMSLSIVLIFYFFSRAYSLFAGIYSIFVSLSSYMVWAYWAEARPYALWVFLTTVQSLIFLHLVKERKTDGSWWTMLTIVHFLLSFTIVFSLAQVAIISFLLWFLLVKDWRRYIGLTVIPIIISIIYYVFLPKYQFWFSLTPEQLIRECFSRDRFYLLFIYIFFLILYALQRKTRFPVLMKDKIILEGLPYFALTSFMLLAAFLVLFIFKLGENPSQHGFPVSNRYFIFLTPIGIISTTLLSVHVIRALSGRIWLQILSSIGIGYLIIHRLLKVLPDIKGLYPELF